MRNVPYWLNIGSILHHYGCATRGEEPKNYSRVTRGAFSHIWGAKGDNLIVMKFCMGIRVSDIITHTNLGDDRFRGY